jgi:hypothetical protein
MDQPGNRLNAGKNDPNLTSEQINDLEWLLWQRDFSYFLEL